jgi:hypothetical protein
MEFLTHFDINIMYIKGEINLVADTLSRYFENDIWDKLLDGSLYVSVDSRLDPEGEDLPWDRFEEARAMCEEDSQCQHRSLQWVKKLSQCLATS